jgi:peptidoglycan/LPS O-acetylase OafA/YrhL
MAKCNIQPGMQVKQQPRAAGYVPALTGIRALAALLVLGMHAEQNVPCGLESLLPFFARGYLGVDLFFILSGFIITHVYFASLARPRLDAIRIFLWHRLIRLYPVHVVVLAGLLVLVGIARGAGIALNNPQDWQGPGLIFSLALLHAWGVVDRPTWNVPSWSISAEWFAYLLFPLLAPPLRWLRDRLAALLVAVLALAATALLFSIEAWSLNTWGGAPALARVLGEFLCGAALCRVVAFGPGLPRPGADILGAGAFAAVLLGASYGLPDFALVALLALTIPAAATSDGLLARTLGGPQLVWLGEVSYSIYMVHFPVLLTMRRLWEWLGFAQWPWAGRASAFLITAALVIALAAIMYHVVERPARTRLRDRLGKLASA